jgi:hypothetical protein
MKLGFGQILTIMGGLHPDAKGNVLEARLKYFHRIPFPASVERVGSGGRAEFSLAESLKLVLTFELLAAGVAPRQAALLIEQSWEKVQPFLARSWISRGQGLDDFIFVHPAGLGSKRGNAGEVSTGDTVAFSIAMKGRDALSRRVISINACSLSGALAAALDGLPKEPRDEAARVRKMIDEWADLAGRQVHVKFGT